jgi:hypothetical protein
MGKMVIFSMYIIGKILNFQGYIKRLDFIYYNNIIFYISDNTHTNYEYHPYHTKNRWYKINLNRHVFPYMSFFITYVFDRWYEVILCQKPLAFLFRIPSGSCAGFPFKHNTFGPLPRRFGPVRGP